MFDKVAKIAPYLAAAVLAYLAYSVVDAGATRTPPEGKDAPGLTKQMLHPELVIAKDHASPAGRDPFEVAWARYVNQAGADKPAPPKAAEDEDEEGSEADAGEKPGGPPKTVTGGSPPTGGAPKAAAPAAGPASPTAPPALGGTVVSGQRRLAVIDDRVYQVGERLKAADPGRRWLVEAIEADRVVLRLGNVQKTLKLRE